MFGGGSNLFLNRHTDIRIKYSVVPTLSYLEGLAKCLLSDLQKMSNISIRPFFLYYLCNFCKRNVTRRLRDEKICFPDKKMVDRCGWYCQIIGLLDREYIRHFIWNVFCQAAGNQLPIKQFITYSITSYTFKADYNKLILEPKDRK